MTHLSAEQKADILEKVNACIEEITDDMAIRAGCGDLSYSATLFNRISTLEDIKTKIEAIVTE